MRLQWGPRTLRRHWRMEMESAIVIDKGLQWTTARNQINCHVCAKREYLQLLFLVEKCQSFFFQRWANPNNLLVRKTCARFYEFQSKIRVKGARWDRKKELIIAIAVWDAICAMLLNAHCPSTPAPTSFLFLPSIYFISFSVGVFIVLAHISRKPQTFPIMPNTSSVEQSSPSYLYSSFQFMYRYKTQ